MSDFIKATMHGVKQFNATTLEVEKNVDFATVKALRANQNLVKREVRKNLRGAPRWTERGSSRVYSSTFRTQPGANTNNPRTGGPGKFSGTLLKGVGGAKPKKLAGTWVGGVGVGGKKKLAANNFKKRDLETRFPYFKPAVEKATPKMPAVYQKAWGKAVEKRGGLL